MPNHRRQEFEHNITEGKRIVDEVFPSKGCRSRLTKYDRIALVMRIDGLLSIAVSEERHRCFDIMSLAQRGIIEPLLK